MRNVYGKLAIAEMQAFLTYRMATILWSLGTFLRIYLLVVFWTAIYGGGGAVAGVTLPQMLTYATLSMLQTNYLINAEVQNYLQERITTGDIIIDLMRPYRFLGGQLAAALGIFVMSLPVALLTLGVFAVFGAVRGPASPFAGAMYAVSLVLGFILNFLVLTLVGLSAFWTFQVGAINWLQRMVAGFLAGAVVPFWFLPPVVQQIFGLFPFQGIVYLPLSIYIGRISGLAVVPALLGQAVWCGILLWAVLRVWRSAQYKLIVQGG